MENALYTLEGRAKIRDVLPFSIQHILSIFFSNLMPVTIVSAVAANGVSSDELFSMLQGVMIAAGVASFVQVTAFWIFGSGLPVMLGSDFVFVGFYSFVASKYGYGAVTATVISSGLFAVILGLTVKYWHKIMTPIVSSCVITSIGLSLLSIATRSFGGGYAEDFGSVPNLIIGAVTLVVCVIWSMFIKSAKKHLAILIAMLAGCITAFFFGKFDLSGVLNGKIITFPTVFPFKPDFYVDLVITTGILQLVSATETLGSISAVAQGVLKRPPSKEELRGAITVKGLGSIVSGLFGGTSLTSYSETAGISLMTGAVNRNVIRCAGIALILAGIFPPLGRIMTSIPSAVLGGVLLVLFGKIMIFGIELISKAGFSEKNKIIASVSIGVGLSFTAATEADLWRCFPAMIQTIFSKNAIAIVFALSVLLDHILPDEKEPVKQD